MDPNELLHEYLLELY